MYSVLLYKTQIYIFFFIKKLFKLKRIFFHVPGNANTPKSMSIILAGSIAHKVFHSPIIIFFFVSLLFLPPFNLFSNFITIFVAFCIYCHIMDETLNAQFRRRNHYIFWSMMKFLRSLHLPFSSLSRSLLFGQWPRWWWQQLGKNMSKWLC